MKFQFKEREFVLLKDDQSVSPKHIQKNRKKLKILLLGAIPPPYGGITIHIQRFVEFLNLKNIDYAIYDFINIHSENKKNLIYVNHPIFQFIKIIFFPKDNIIHSHLVNEIGIYVMGFFGLIGKNTIITLHGENILDEWETKNFIKKIFIKYSLKNISHIIVVNTNIFHFCLSIGISPKKISVIPAFIPPTEKKEDFDNIPKRVWEFLEVHQPIIVANAFKITFIKNQDLYGIDMCVELCYKLKQKWSNIGFLFFLPVIGNEKYFNELLEKIINYDMENNFLFVTKPIQMYPVLGKSDILVRPTNTDGDSVSIRESLYYGIPVIASDCVIRPKEVILFQTGNLEQFIEKVTEVLANYVKYKNLVDSIMMVDETEEILKIYYNVWGMKCIE